MPDLIIHTTSLAKKILLTPDMLELRLHKPEGFTFKPGQFIQIQIPDQFGQAVLRSYSLASHPSADYLALCVKIVPGGKGSTYFSQMSEGQQLSFRGPEGRFVVLPEHSPTKVFVATGAGIAPIMSMLEDEIAKPSNERLHLLFGLRHDHDVFWTEHFERFSSISKVFTYRLSLSQPSATWTGDRGRVTDHVSDVPKTGNWYLCGSLPMVKDMRTILAQAGLPMKQIHFEIF